MESRAKRRRIGLVFFGGAAIASLVMLIFIAISLEHLTHLCSWITFVSAVPGSICLLFSLVFMTPLLWEECHLKRSKQQSDPTPASGWSLNEQDPLLPERNQTFDLEPKKPKKRCMCLMMFLYFLFLVFLVLLSGLCFFTVHMTTSKSLHIPSQSAGLHADVNIDFEKDGVPHIRGEHRDDVMFALGAVTASRRLWQMVSIGLRTTSALQALNSLPRHKQGISAPCGSWAALKTSWNRWNRY